MSINTTFGIEKQDPWSVSDALPGKNRAFLSIFLKTLPLPVVFGQFSIFPDSTLGALCIVQSPWLSPGQLCRSLQRVYSQSLKGVSPSASQGCDGDRVLL